MRRLIHAFCCALAVAALAVVLGRPASAHEFPCDFLTGGGFIEPASVGTYPAGRANFGVGGGCKHGSPTWGHLQYIDHGNGLNVHWTAITAYLMEGDGGDPPPDPQTRQPLGKRLICGTARTNHYGDVDFMVIVEDNGEPGTDDEFDIRLARDGVVVYSTEVGGPHKLGGGDRGGGNIQLHKPNPSTTGGFGGECPARAAI